MAAKLLNGLTIKQDRFCREYVANEGNGAAAYRAAYDAENMSDQVIYNEASKLLDRREVAVRVEQLQERACIMADQTVENLIAELQDAVKLAKNSNNAAAMSNAVMAKAKLLGHVVDRREDKVSVERPADKPDLAELLNGSKPSESVPDSAIPEPDEQHSKLTH
jgi:hypothetical protein